MTYIYDREKYREYRNSLFTPVDTLFNNFNKFILSDDRRVFGKLVARTLLCEMVQNVPGDIVECGVFKGTGIYTFLKLNEILNPHKKVIGFDFFNTDALLDSLQPSPDKDVMQHLFTERNFRHNQNFKTELTNQLIQHGFSNFMLIEGDVSLTTKEFVEKNPGFRISLLYMDLDLEEPTYNTLVNLWDNITPGGIVVFDEYGYHEWSEAKGVDRFIQENNLKLECLNFACPTAYIRKN